MEGPLLQLFVEKGPREGELLDCKPGSTIRIGRVVKGNTFTIKDAGISSKHLLIEFKDVNWVVFDLETSNGTCLNEVQIDGMKGFDLSDGDVIKIGEFTSLKVRIVEESKVENDQVRRGSRRNGNRREGFGVRGDEDIVEEVRVDDQIRRIPKRGAASKISKRSTVETVVVEDVPVEVSKNRRLPLRSTRAAKDKPAEFSLGFEFEKVDDSKGVENGVPIEENQTQGVGRRGRKKATSNVLEDVFEFEKVDNSKNDDNGAPVVEKLTRGVARRGRKKAASNILEDVLVFEKVDNSKNVDNGTLVEEKLTRGVSRRGRKKAASNVSKDVFELEKVDDFKRVGNEVPFEEKQSRGVATRGRKKAVSNVSEDVPPIEEKQTRRVGLRKGKGLQNEASKDVPIPNISESSKIPTESHSAQEIPNESNDNQPCIDEKLVPTDAENAGKKLDLEKMTLGEWFDYLEVYLPKQIHDETGKVIASMRERAKKFNEFLAEQQDMKGKCPLA